MNPLLVVRILTYNHEKYIRRCLDGVVMQSTNFPIKVIIGEDCSTDNTASICKEYVKKYPELFEIHCNNINNLQINSANNWELCFETNAKFIALLEGDDYWTDPFKLQKQIDFLEANPDYVACFHKVKILETSGDLVDDYITIVPKNHEHIEDLARDGNYIHTPSVVFRNIIKKFPEELFISPVGDYFLYMLLAQHGKFKYLTDTMAVYRNGVGNHSSKTQHDKEISFNITLFLIWHIFIKSNKTVSSILFIRIRAKLDQLLQNSDLIYQLTKNDINHNNLVFSLIEQLEYSHRKEIDSVKENAINDFLKRASLIYLLKVISYKIGFTRLIRSYSKLRILF